MKTLTLMASLILASGLAAEDITVSKAGSRPAEQVRASNFTGVARVERLFGAVDPARASGGLVHFEAGARTFWHTHPLGQTLIVTAGLGRVQQWGGPVQEIRQGDVVRIPPGVKHWHGASPDTALSHIAISEALDGKAVEWMEPVEDAQYAPSVPVEASGRVSTAPSRAQQLFGEVAPKLAALTDDVLYADVWARPQLGRRDRSLATVSALIAMNRPDQLRSHLVLAKQNGLTEEELSEAITHLAFYAGWPSAVSAAVIAKEVFAEK